MTNVDPASGNIFRSWSPLLLNLPFQNSCFCIQSIRFPTFKFLVTEFNKNRHIFIFLLRKQENQILGFGLKFNLASNLKTFDLKGKLFRSFLLIQIYHTENKKKEVFHQLQIYLHELKILVFDSEITSFL